MTGDAADAAGDVGAMVEVDVIGQVVDLLPMDGGPAGGALAHEQSLALAVAIVAWQFMQVAVGGTAASAAFSTVLWQ